MVGSGSNILDNVTALNEVVRQVLSTPINQIAPLSLEFSFILPAAVLMVLPLILGALGQVLRARQEMW